MRDGRCVITHTPCISINNWTGLRASHVFPLAYEKTFIESNSSRWITNLGEGETGINSCQNGLLLAATVHQLFDMYQIAIDPDV